MGKVGFVLEGGAMRGIYTAGVIDVFLRENIKADGFIGVSAGALFGMNYKSKQIGRVLRYNKKYCNSKEYMGFHSLLTTGNIMNKDFCFDKIVNKLDPVDFKTFKENKVDFYCVVTNIESGKPEYIKIDDLKDKKQIEYMRASGSMPYVSKIVEIDGKKYLDGGIADSIPIDKMFELGYDKIIVVLTRPIEYRKKKSNSLLAKTRYKKYPNFIDTILNRYKMYNDEVEKVIKLEKEGKIFVIRPSKLVEINRLEKDVNKIQEMYDLGVKDVTEKLDELKEFLM